MPARRSTVEDATKGIRWYFVAIALFAGAAVLGAALAARTAINTGDGPVVAMLVVASVLTLVRLASATKSARLRPVVPLAFLYGLVANIAMFFSILRYALGGDTSRGDSWLPVTMAHLVTVILYGVVLVSVYRGQRLSVVTGRLLFAIAYAGVVLTFVHVLFV